MKPYSYVVKEDSGFAPNPFWGYCTLATCKPNIRKVAKVGEWVFGFGSATNRMAHSLIYAMQVDEVLSLGDYYLDPRFEAKKPLLTGSPEQRCGDNIYRPNPDETLSLCDSFHCEDDEATDLQGKYVLISQNYWYFGRKAPLVPLDCQEILLEGRGHSSKGNPERAITWLRNKYRPGIHGKPVDFNEVSFGTGQLVAMSSTI